MCAAYILPEFFNRGLRGFPPRRNGAIRGSSFSLLPKLHSTWNHSHGGFADARSFLFLAVAIHDSAGDGFGELLAVDWRAGDAGGALRIAEKTRFDEDRRDAGVADDEKTALANVAILQATDGQEAAMNGLGETGALRAVVIGLHAVRGGPGCAVEMDADEDGVALSVGDVAALPETHEVVAVTGEDDVVAVGAQDGREAEADIEGVGFFRHDLAGRAAAVVAAMTGIDDDRRDGASWNDREEKRNAEESEKGPGTFHGKPRESLWKRRADGERKVWSGNHEKDEINESLIGSRAVFGPRGAGAWQGTGSTRE